MRKLLIISIAFVAFSLKAQNKKISLSAGPSISFPTGTFVNNYGLGFGAEVQAVYPIASSWEAFGQIGYQYFSGKTVTTPATTYMGITVPGSSVSLSAVGHIPFIIGARYKKAGGIIGGLGIGFGNFSGGGDSESGFAFSPQMGYNISKFDLLIHYTSVLTTGDAADYFGIKVFYKLF